MAGDPHTDEACRHDISSARVRSSDPASSLKLSRSKSAGISSGMMSTGRTPPGKILPASKEMQKSRKDMTPDMISSRKTGRTPPGKILPASKEMQKSRKAPSIFTRKSKMTESSPGSAESKEKRLRCTTGIIFLGWPFEGDSFNRPPLSELLMRCEILSSEKFGDYAGIPSINELATLVADGKLTNGLCCPILPSDVAHCIESLQDCHPDLNILLVDWNCYLPPSFKQTRVLRILLGSEHNLRNIPEGEPSSHIKIFLYGEWTRLPEDDHLAIFQSIVMPVAEEFKPDMVVFVLDHWTHRSMKYPYKSCIGHLIGMLMKLADGKVVVCNNDRRPNITEVSLSALLSDYKDSLPNRNHPTAEGSKMIKRTVKEYVRGALEVLEREIFFSKNN